MGVALDRIDPAVLGREGCAELIRVLEGGATLVGAGGGRFDLPEAIARFLAHAARAMAHGQAVALVGENEALTTQEAADLLGVSRPFLIGLLEKGEIPFHMTGTHRRLLARDVRAYGAKRDRERRAALDEVFDAIDRDGLYELGLDPKLGQGG